MNNDFFTELERQLVDATRERRARLRRARARRAAAVSTILIAVLAAGGGLAAAITTSDATNRSGAPARGGAVTVPGRTVVAPGSTVPFPGGAQPQPGTFTVAVLNGTTVPGAARGVANLLRNGHYKIGNVTNAATQDATTTRVYYATTDGIPAATEVADALGRIGDITPLEAPPSLRTLAGDQAKVIVVVGADQAPPAAQHRAGGR
jgi:hypothetical protein